MDRFLEKRALGSPVGKREQEQTGAGSAESGEDEESTRKRPRTESPGNGTGLAGLSWRRIRSEGLDCDYTVLFGKAEADEIFQELEREVEYFTGTRTAATTSGNTEMTNESWLLGAPSPPSPLGPAGTSSSGTKTLAGGAAPGGWRRSGCRWPTGVY
ncbi:DNA oxidative demethylase ALKBH2 isoform X2 [Pipistrellus kuhlii]|uniref:AlkB-like protein 2, alpha-ketoglutarate dependent dioxygenase n=1 Tax=Pipistrellus kuhlii TaxID=59472 RepID=A0A7J7UFJ5_PIPKU|nr:DNA oxidative demethylase ALKBH2 isoform X2 [Pipistrellus kuhlii]KAF6311542.1 alkB-like protein 2, alpha-ketoglutarate dependent dioxygenase [Pipistrellus kuhlii]